MPKDYIIFTFFFLYYLFDYQAFKLCDPYMVSLVRIWVKAQSRLWAPEYGSRDVKNVHESLIESTLCHCRICYKPPP